MASGWMTVWRGWIQEAKAIRKDADGGNNGGGDIARKRRDANRALKRLTRAKDV